MNTPTIWSDFHEEFEIRQGDVICKNKTPDQKRYLGVVINADCDIAQGKNSSIINYLKIVDARDYAEAFWAPKQIEKIVEKRTRSTLEFLNSKMKKSHPTLNALSREKLHHWLKSSGLRSILTSLNICENEVPANVLSSMEALEVALNESEENNAIARLSLAFERDNRKREDLEASLFDEFSNPKGFPDYIFLPEIPGLKGFGFVVQLREILVAQQDNVFPNEFLGKISNQNDYFYRVARLSDVFRYSIAQKLAFLFSRIGVPSELEHQQKDAARLAVIDILELEK